MKIGLTRWIGADTKNRDLDNLNSRTRSASSSQRAKPSGEFLIKYLKGEEKSMNTIIISVRDRFISYSGPADVEGPTVLLPVGRRNLPQHRLLHNEHHAKYTSDTAERLFSGTLRSAALVQVPNDFVFYDGAPRNSRHVELELKPGFILFDSRLAIVTYRPDEHVLGHRSHLQHFCSISGDRRKADDSGPQKHARAPTGCTCPKESEGAEPGLFFGCRRPRSVVCVCRDRRHVQVISSFPCDILSGARR
jgi:hypothetical protein